MKRISRLLKHCLLLLLCLPLLQQASAQGCGCKIVLGLSDWNITSTYKGITFQPGDTICLGNDIREGGYIFSNLHGTREQPIVIANQCNGQNVTNCNWSDVFKFENCSNIRVTGARNPNDSFGIEINGGSMAMRFWKFSTDIEVDHIKITNMGCCGMVIKTDPDTCNPATWRPNFTMRNIKVHDNYISNIGCEAFYIGNSHYDEPQNYHCNGTPVTFYEHDVDSVQVYNNYLQDIGADGIQVGSATNAVIHNNTVRRWGWQTNAGQNKEFHNNGIQIGAGTTKAIAYDNYLFNDGVDMSYYGIFDQGGGGTIFNNVCIGMTKGGILLSDPSSNYAPAGFTVVNNTLANYNGYAINLFASNPAYKNAIKNNIFAARPGQTNYYSFGGGTNAYTDTLRNYRTDVIANVRFVDPSNENFRLLYNSPAVNTGVNTSAYGVTVDFEDITRPQWRSWDLGAYEYHGTQQPPIDTLITPGDTTVTPPSGDTVFAKFNFTDRSQTVGGGWTSLDSTPHSQVITVRDNNSGFTVSSISTTQWRATTQDGRLRSSGRNGVQNGSVQPPEIVVSYWFTYNAAYGDTVNNVVQGDNLALTGLAPNTDYILKIGASRVSSIQEEYGNTEYRFNGVDPHLLNVRNNTSNQVVDTVRSDASGRIGISARKVKGSTGNFGYVGWLTVNGPRRASTSRVGVVTTASQQAPIVPSLLLYPNPADNSATLDLATFRDQLVEVSIFSTVGTLIQQRSLRGGNLYRMTTSALSNGVYFVRVKSIDKHVTVRLVINR